MIHLAVESSATWLALKLLNENSRINACLCNVIGGCN